MTFIIDGTAGETFPDSSVQATSALVAGRVPRSAMPVGSVVQTAYSTYSVMVSTTGTTPVTTGLSGSITPTSTSNKVLVTFNIPSTRKPAGTNNCDMAFQIWRNGSSIVQPTTNFMFTGTSLNQTASFSYSYLDSPASTSTLTYTIYFFDTQGSGGSIQVQLDNTPSTIILQEIAQ